VYALLGRRRTEALEQANAAVRTAVQAPNFRETVWSRWLLASVAVEVGAADVALAELRAQLRTPSFMSPAALRGDATWQLLSAHPDFAALVDASAGIGRMTTANDNARPVTTHDGHSPTAESDADGAR